MVSDTYRRYASAAVAATSCIENCNESAIIQELGEALHLGDAAIHRRKAGQVLDPAFTLLIARMGVRRGMLTQLWLETFLRAGNYADHEALVAELFPDLAPAPPGRQVLANLPAPSYSRFTMRPRQYDAIAQALHRHGMVVILGAGGMGKSSLALEVARHCLNGASPEAGAAPPTFDSAIWVSDRTASGRLSLSAVLDTVVRVLGAPQLTSRALDARRSLVDQLLRQRRVLLVADNLETVTDDDLLAWLAAVPEPSKVIVTTRSLDLAFLEGASLVAVGAMSEQESQHLLRQRLEELQLELFEPETTAALLNAAGGNPKALNLLLGQLRLGRLHDTALRNVLSPSGELLTELFDRAWALLDADAREVFLATTLFYAVPERRDLAAVAGLSPERLEAALATLFGLSLLDQQHKVGPVHRPDARRIGMHALARHYAEGRLRELPAVQQALQARWFAWCVSFAREHGGFVLDDVARLTVLEAAEPDLDAALTLAAAQGRHHDLIALARGLEFLYYVTAEWDKKIRLHERYIEAARLAGATSEEIYALALHIQLLSRQGRPQQVAAELARLVELATPLQADPTTFFTLHHTSGLYALACGDLVTAQHCWQCIRDRAPDLPHDMLHAALHWTGRVLQLQEEHQTARAAYEEACALAQTHGLARFEARNLLRLAELDISEGQYATAWQRMDACRAKTSSNDAELQAWIHLVSARLCAAKEYGVSLVIHLRYAIQLFRRMDMQREWQSAEAWLRALGASID